MVAALGEEVFSAAAGDEVIVDGTNGVAVLRPETDTVTRARAAAAREAAEHRAARVRPAATHGHRRRPSDPAARERELARPRSCGALRRGVEGVGLLRTELAFLDSDGWPSEDEHFEALAPVLGAPRGPDRHGPDARLRRGQDAAVPSRPRRAGHRSDARARGRARGAACRDPSGRRTERGCGSCSRSSSRRRSSRRPESSCAGQPPIDGRPAPQLGAMIETPRGATRVERARTRRRLLLDRDERPRRDDARARSRSTPLASALSAADPAVVALIGRTVRRGARGRNHGRDLRRGCGRAAS